jgi:CubicO group peptidase (beta-lactamase class C family)
VLSALILLVSPAFPEPPKLDLQAQVERVRTDYGLVAMGAVVATSEAGVVALAVSGERAKGRADPVQPSDAWHIGSNTKMLTALLYARLVEAGHADWGATLPELFPALAAEMDAGWRKVTIEDLLSHRSGAAPNASLAWMLGSKASKQSLPVQRANLARTVLTAPPAGKPGEFTYSNLGYILAGGAIERLAAGTPSPEAKSYELLMREYVIAKAPAGAGLGFGFGPPRSGIEGHAPGLFGFGVTAQGRGAGADNPAALGPAGTAHHSLRGHALMLLSFLEGPRALPEAIRKKLLTHYPDQASDYGLGWANSMHDEAGRIYMHAGSNTVWLSQVVLAPDHGAVIIVNTNQHNPKAEKAVRELTEFLLRHVSGAVEWDGSAQVER